MTFDDEFNGNSLDLSKWSVSNGVEGIYDRPLQVYVPDEVSVQNGYLRIRTEQRSYRGYPYTSGEIWSMNKFAQKYGRFEVRCRFPVNEGTWSATYLLPADNTWPPEIDITEFIGKDPDNIYFTNHYKDFFGNHRWDSENFPVEHLGKWHVYTIEWGPGDLRWFVDGVQKREVTRYVSDVPMFLRINTAVGGDFAGDPTSTGWPQYYDVDYVRVYRRAGEPGPLFGKTANRPLDLKFRIAPPTQAEINSGAGNTTAADVEGVLSAVFGTMLLMLIYLITLCSPFGLRFTTQMMGIAVALTAINYLWWRCHYINWDAPWIGVPLFLAELFGILQVLGFHYTVWPRTPAPLQPLENPTLRPIYILIPTVNEGVAVVEPTLRGAIATREHYLSFYPDASVTIAVCNDGLVNGYEHWQEVTDLAEALGVQCVTRTVPGGAKAGNIEGARQALGATGNALIAIFDADMVPEKRFLTETIKPFSDPSVGWVQTGQYYRNLDNPMACWANDQQSIFFRALCSGKAAQNACFICGTNVLLAAAALDQIGGLPQDTPTEDFAASVMLHGRWRSVYLKEVLATGLGPVDLPAYFSQQRRWAIGTFGVLKKFWRQILLPHYDGLTFGQRMQYLLSGTHYFTGVCSLIFLIAPLVFLLTGISPFSHVDFWDFFAHFVPYFVTSQLAFRYAAGRRSHWRGSFLGFISFPTLVSGFLTVLVGRTTRFIVTAKRRRKAPTWRSLVPHTIALAACGIGLNVALKTWDTGGLMSLATLWTIYMVIMLLSAFRLGLADFFGGRAPGRVPASRMQVVQPLTPDSG
jgi:cellulose synthase/poly-beta-1,6-N-acetylglucosamine synthase-like glycosyltransferase